MKLTKQLYALVFIVLTGLFLYFAVNIVRIEYNLEQYEIHGKLEKELYDIGEKFSAYITIDDLKSFIFVVDDMLAKKKYKILKITSNQGKVLFNKSIDDADKRYKKNWLLNYFKILEDKITIPVIYKNEQIASIEATIFKEYFQNLSWNGLKLDFVNLLLLYIIFIALSFIALYIVLRPLKNIILHINKISERKFFIDNNLYFATDMENASDKLNKISIKLNKVFDENNEFCQLVRANTYQDKITDVGNERYFKLNMEQMLRGSESGIGGLVFVLQFNIDELIIANAGITQYKDTVIRLLAANLQSLTKEKHKIDLLSHLGNGEFLFIAKDLLSDQNGLDKCADDYCKYIIEKFKRLKVDESEQVEVKVFIGITEYQQGSFVEDVLNQADESLNKAKASSESNYVKYDKPRNKLLLPNINWREHLKKLMLDEEFIVQYEPVFYYEKDGTLLFHNESLVRIKSEGKEFVHAGSFLPIVQRENMSAELDSFVIKTLFEIIKGNPEGFQRYGVNLSREALMSDRFLKWLTKQLERAGDFSRRLTFEFKESDVESNVKALEKFIKVVSKFNIQVGLDHFGCGFYDYKYLEPLGLAYVKMDGSYSRRIHENTDNQAIVRSFIEVCHSMDMLVIATDVEIEQERVALNNLHVDGMQGFLIGQPK